MCTKCIFVISGSIASRLVRQAHVRMDSALRPRTASAYLSKFKLYLAFITWFHLPVQDLSSILAFLELLTQHGSRAHSLTSYISVLRHYFKFYDIDSAPLAHRKVHLFIKSVSMNSVYVPKFKANITISLLCKIVSKCDSMTYGCVYKAVFLLAYFAFLHLSNLVPISAKSFDVTRNLLRSDVIFGSPGAHVIIKWSKAMQSSSSHQVVQIPTLHPSPLCPVAALKALLRFVPVSSSSPLFLLPLPSGLSILTSSMVSSTLSRIVLSLGLNPSNYGFHAFRRSAVSWAADHNVSLQNLKAHGGWASSAINHYLKHTPKASSTVASTFQQILLK